MGLLDVFNTDQGRMGLGLLAAAGPRSDGAGFGQRLQEGVGSFDAYKQNALKQKMLEAQMQQAMEQAAQQKADRARQQTIQQGMGQFFNPGQAAQPATAPVKGFTSIDSMLPPEMQIGMPGRPAMPAVAPSFDTAGAAQFLAQNGEYDKAIPMLQSLQPKERTLKEGETVFMGDKPFLSVPKAPKEIDPNKPFMMVDGRIIPNDAYQAFELKRSANSAPKMSVDLRDPTAVAKAAMSFQNDYRAATKTSYARAQAYESMMQAAKDPSAKGDLTMVYSFIKALDPESVVREGEIDLVNANRSVPDKVKGYAQKLATGQNLLPNERQDLIKQAQTLTQTDYKRSRNDVKAYRDNAQRLGLDADLYAPDPYAGFKPAADQKPTTGKTVVKTGMYGGRKVVQYEDGTTDYAN